MQLRRVRDGAAFGGQAIEELKAFEARTVEIVVDVVGEVFANGVDGQTETGTPFVGENVWMFSGRMPRSRERMKISATSSLGEASASAARRMAQTAKTKGLPVFSSQSSARS